MEKYPLNETLSPITHEERLKLLENWRRITSYFNSLEGQIRTIAGGEDIDELLQRITGTLENAEIVTADAVAAIQQIEYRLIVINTAITNADAATTNANTARTNANNAAAAANAATSNANTATTAANNATSAANTAKTNAEQATTNANNATTAANNATSAANTAKTNAEQATTNANNATTDAIEAKNNADIAAANAIQATDNANDIIDLMNTLKMALKTLQQDLSDIIQAEIERKDNEILRIESEGLRGLAEQGRVEAENDRAAFALAQEQDETERKLAEELRELAETNRQNKLNELLDILNAFDFIGEYNPSTTYKAFNVVRFGRNSYVALRDVTGVIPTDDGIDWRMLAAGGIDGTGAVSSVNNTSPDVNGNVNLIINYINNLLSDRTDIGLSAAMGKQLKILFDEHTNEHIDVVITDTDIPIDQRTKSTFYLYVHDRTPII